MELGDDRAWTEGDHLVANLIDVEERAIWQRGGNSSAPKPKRLPRPSEMAALRERNDTLSRQAAMFADREKRRAEILGTTAPTPA